MLSRNPLLHCSNEMKVPLLSFALAASLAAQPAASLVLIHGKVWTVNPAQPQAEGVACIGSRIVAVGSSAEIGRPQRADDGSRDQGAAPRRQPEMADDEIPFAPEWR